jgi:hypothetical protein
MEAKRNAYKNAMGKPEGKKPLGRPRRMWEDNIKWIFDIRMDAMERIDPGSG